MDKYSKAIALIAEILETNVSQITHETAFRDISGWDSMAQLQIIGEFENLFKIEIPIEKMADIKTVKDILDYLD
jgi:acyl carrier protein